MNNSPEDGVLCGIDGCGPVARESHRPEECIGTSSAARHELTIVSDVICPWCFVAKRNLERALDLLPNRGDYVIKWRPYELNPRMPREGMDRREYRSRKFGSWEHSVTLDAQVTQAGSRPASTSATIS